jgi:NADPH2:quinone reductase
VSPCTSSGTSGHRTRWLTALADLVDSGDLCLHVGHAVPLAEAAKAHHLIDSGSTTGKVVLTM